uniref:Bm10902, isoform b n=1 Tax=Brugia malayi TaxID=6279 RepID=A0A1I9G4Q6_BRUMA|nr:Bm10902, isoform b [Brugia malayi]
MHRQLISRLTLLSITVCLTYSKEYAKLYCPNSQLPEMDDNDTVKQCLPGHEELCGPGYSCYFSGTNYQCCPTEEGINLDSTLECPSPSVTILTDAGLPLICTPGLHACPQSSMQCLNVGKHSICCEELSSIIDTSHGAISPKEINSPDETIQPIALNNELFNAPNLECPEPAFTILDGNGDPVPCTEEDCAHQSGRFCYKSLNTPICCESGERNIDEDVLIKKILQRNKPEKEGSIGWSVLKYTPLTTAQRQQHENELLQYDNQLESDVSNVSRQPVLDRTTSEQSVSSNQAKTLQTFTTASSTIITTAITPALITSKTSEPQLFEKPNHQSLSLLSEKPQENETETIRYKPHNAGGYAVSQAFSSKIRRAPNDLRALAREYLLEHIRRGWPYSDEFYRSYSEFYTI